MPQQPAGWGDPVPSYGSSLLTFHGVDGFDAYNPSIPFTSHGKQYIYARVERRDEYHNSSVRLFEAAGPDEWCVADGPAYLNDLEDPCVATIDGELILGATRHGDHGDRSEFFVTRVPPVMVLRSPATIKNLRLLQLADGRNGIFTRPRSAALLEQGPCEAMIGFTLVARFADATEEVIRNAPLLHGLYGPGEWGGVAQAHQLKDSGRLGVVAHHCYNVGRTPIYRAVSFIFDPETREFSDRKLLATRSSFPPGPSKDEALTEVAYPAGLIKRPDGRCDLYSGLRDTQAGRVTIDDPFAGHDYDGFVAPRFAEP